MIKNVFDEIFSMENLYEAYREASEEKRYNRGIVSYHEDVWENLTELREEIYRGEYEVSDYNIFYIYEPKYRVIASLKFRDRIVQWAIYKVINPYLIKGYITDTYGCIEGRGNLRAAKKIKYWMEQDYRKKPKYYYLQIDISKYFYRVDHEVLKGLLRKKISDKRLLKILDKIINKGEFGLPRFKNPEDTDVRLNTKGMAIGNLMSQMFANMYLDQLDQFCKRTLKARQYARYMDDAILLHKDKRTLHEWREKIRRFLAENLKLDLNSKTCIRPISVGAVFCGYKITPWRLDISRATSLKAKRSIKGILKKYSCGEMQFEEARERYLCYIGMLKNTDSVALRDAIMEKAIFVRRGDGRVKNNPKTCRS